MKALALTHKQLCTIGWELEKRIIEGLEEDDHKEVRCLLSYLPVPEARNITGEALALDLGGTHVRAAHIAMSHGVSAILKKTAPEKIPWNVHSPFKVQDLLDLQVGHLVCLGPPAGLPLGYCFSYATESTSDGDARLIEMGKEVTLDPDISGQCVGKMLLEHIRGHHLKPVEVSSVRVLNDAVAGLFAGLAESGSDEHIIGIVVGTGTNMATFMDPGVVPKLAKKHPGWKGPIAVNLESGNFIPPFLTPLDDMVDAQSDPRLRGKQRFEKAVAGKYLGYLHKVAFPESDFDPETGSEGLLKLAHTPPQTGIQAETACRIFDRSSRMVAAGLAGLMKFLNKPRFLVIAEGGLFWRAPGYKELAESTLRSVLMGLGCGDLEFRFKEIPEANLKGSGLAALL